MESFSTKPVPPGKKVAFWNEISSDTFAPLEVIPRDSSQFEAQLYREMVGPLALADARSSAGTILHTQRHIRRAAEHNYNLTTPVAGSFQVSIDRQPPIDLHVGEFCLLDQGRPYQLTFTEPVRAFCIVLPHHCLSDLLPDPARLVGVHMRPERSLTRMLVSLLQDISRELTQHRSFVTPVFAQSLTGFVAAAYSEAVEVADSCLAQARRRCICNYIESKLHEPQLRPAAIADHFRISPRYLRAIFGSGDESVSSYLLRRRLEKSAGLLRDPAWRMRTITEIAFHVGFNNATHFGHAFKKRFDVTPRDYRGSALP